MGMCDKEHYYWGTRRGLCVDIFSSTDETSGEFLETRHSAAEMPCYHISDARSLFWLPKLERNTFAGVG